MLQICKHDDITVIIINHRHNGNENERAIQERKYLFSHHVKGKIVEKNILSDFFFCAHTFRTSRLIMSQALPLHLLLITIVVICQ